MQNQPFIHLFETSNGYYFYDVNTDSILNINKESYDSLLEIEKNPEKWDKSNKSEQLILLKNIGYLKPNKHRITEHPETEFLKYHSKNRIEGIILQLTQNCNLRCSYCAYSGGYINRVHNNKRMSMETAIEGIDFLLRNSKDCEEINIAFYGGEPLLEFNLIKDCIEYVKNNVEGRLVRYNLTTNGTLLTDEVVRYFEENAISVMVSLDGPADIHDRNRRFTDSNDGSFDIIVNNLKRIQSEYPKYFEENITYNTVLAGNDFACINKFFSKDELFQNSLFISSFLNEANAKFVNQKSYTFYEENAYAIFIGYLTLLGKVKENYAAKILQSSINGIGDTREGKQGKQRMELPEKWHHGGPCVPGIMRLFINVDGNFYPCEKVSESSEHVVIGNVKEGFLIDKMEGILNIENINQENCLKCWAYQDCKICIASLSDNPHSEEIEKECRKTKSRIESDFKDYCVLRDLGYDFEIKDFIDR